MFYLYLILIYIMYVSYKCSNAIQETRIPSEIGVRGKHVSLMGNTHPYGYVCGKHFTRENTHPYDTGSDKCENQMNRTE